MPTEIKVRISEPIYLPCFVVVLFGRSKFLALASAVHLAIARLVSDDLLLVLAPQRERICLDA